MLVVCWNQCCVMTEVREANLLKQETALSQWCVNMVAWMKVVLMTIVLRSGGVWRMWVFSCMVQGTIELCKSRKMCMQ